MSDLISRQDAIDALMAHFIPQTYTGEQVEQAKKLAQKIMNEVPPVTPKVSDDCISRADLLGKMKSLCPKPDKDCGYCHKACDIEDCIDFVVDAPSVTPTERTGKWIPVTKVYRTTEADFPETHIEWETATEPDEIDAVRCSECGEVFDFEDARNWCTECGAKMGGD